MDAREGCPRSAGFGLTRAGERVWSSNRYAVQHTTSHRVESRAERGAGTREHVRSIAGVAEPRGVPAPSDRGLEIDRANEDFLFQPEYGDSLNVDGARFIGLVEPAGSGSRIRGHVVAAPLTRASMSIFVLAVVFAALAALGQGVQSSAKVLSIASMLLGGALLMVRYSVR